MKRTSPRTIWLKDYRPAPYLVDTVHLDVELGAERTIVRSKLRLRPTPAAEDGSRPLTLDGTGFELESLAIDGRPLPAGSFAQNGEGLTLYNPPVGAFELAAVTVINPSVNKALQGLYQSKGVFCTQCEAEGFRRITYMLDRPDVLARYTVRLSANLREAPVLLANGNLQERGTLANGRHYAVWHDPHPKPSYLFAMVAGDLGSIASDFTTQSGKRVDLRIYVEHGKEPRAAWAMDALKRSMRWDEVRFGREYDLEQFNIVAVSDFNMGAMENKGLNIFNDRLILASAESATDAQFEAIESVVAHEYFHNWTGNRITCRDWFQLCLKEGLTVYRDQEFSSDERSRTVQRISDVRQLKALQFPEDSGPLSHPVRPESYIEINNFYTATVYEKGAEVVRMLECLLGAEVFRAGMDLYFARHDGQAATIEDFIACFETASSRDLAQFKLWYSEAGTPQLDCRTRYDQKAEALELEFTQRLPSERTNNKNHPKPFVIPVRIGLIGKDGRDAPLKNSEGVATGTDCLVVTKAQQTFRFGGLKTRPAVSILRGFSAPVALTIDYTDADLKFLSARDSDPFNRWQALQTYAMRTLLANYQTLKAGKRSSEGGGFVTALKAAIGVRGLEPAYLAELLKLPTVSDLIREAGADIDPGLAYRAHRQLARRIGRTLGSDLERLYSSLRTKGVYSPDAAAAGKRAVRNVALTLLTVRAGDSDRDRLKAHYFSATNMTDQAHALNLLAHQPGATRTLAFDDFLERWKGDDLVIDLWFAAQAQSVRASTLQDVRRLLGHPLFKITTPNKVRALVGTFTMANPLQFHRPDGAGYDFLATQVLAIDRFNPQVASRLLSSLRNWRTLEPVRRNHAQRALVKIAGASPLSRDVHEIAAKMGNG